MDTFGHKMQRKSWELTPEEQAKEDKKAGWVLLGIFLLMIAFAVFFFIIINR